MSTSQYVAALLLPLLLLPPLLPLQLTSPIPEIPGKEMGIHHKFHLLVLGQEAAAATPPCMPIS
jgi:hypothetical protein